MDCIVANASAPGRAAISLIRLSGPDARKVVTSVCPGCGWKPRRVHLRHATDLDGSVLDEVLAVWMPAPNSYTGEDVVEVSCHGNPLVARRLVERFVEEGARLARPGEFTRRALEHGRLTLPRAEAVAALIQAQTLAGAKVAQSASTGAIDQVVLGFREELLDLGSELEARLDQPEGDLELCSDEQLVGRLAALSERAAVVAGSWRASRIQLAGATVALVGPVNAGKSSLFNRLVGSGRALVSERPGTTRDAVERTVELEGLSICFIDTAGGQAASDELDAAGQRLGEELATGADLRLVVRAGHQDPTPEWASCLAGALEPRLVVATHLDCCVAPPADVDVAVSSTTGVGVDDLRARIVLALAPSVQGGTHVVSERQHDRFVGLARHTARAGDALQAAGAAVAAAEVAGALETIADLLGEDVTEAVLDRLFARFCIGK